ncbi:MAG: hypothetical protein HDQ96_07715 [Lachnospiraceae bacterium]|nr:hypothetical protein [Lachnospiraceae bacterium]
MEYDVLYEPADIVIHVQGKGIVLKEKSLVAFQKNDNKVVAYGTDAERLIGKDTDNIVVLSPFRQGMVWEFTVAVKLFSLLFKKAFGKKFFKRPKVAVCVPTGITPVEKKAIMDMLNISVVAKELFIVDIPVETFIREFPEKFPNEYRKFKITVGITKDEPERYVEEKLKDALIYAEQEQISPDRVCELLQRLKE